MQTNIDESILYKDFFDLVMREGVSPSEALSFILVRKFGIPPSKASEVIKELLGKEVKNTKISVYVDRARIKLMENGTLYEYGEINLDH